MTHETKIILGSTIVTILTTAIGLAVLITTLFLNLGGRIDTVETRLESRIEGLRTDMREDYQRLDDRMRTIEQGFAKIDQRLVTLERVLIPTPEPAGIAADHPRRAELVRAPGPKSPAGGRV